MNEALHSLSDNFNAFLDGLNAASWRLLELPLFVLLLGLIAVFVVVWQCLRLSYSRIYPGAELRVAYLWAALAFFLLAVALVADHKIVSTLNEVRGIYTQQVIMASQRTADVKPKPPVTDPTVKQQLVNYSPNCLYDPAGAEQALGKVFGEFHAVGEALHEAVDYVVIQAQDPGRSELVILAFLAIVDLTNDDIEIKITPSLGEKYPTTDFARHEGCLIAINGEAGKSPMPGSGFGEWIGNWIVRGKPIMLESANRRPFLVFDHGNRAKYYGKAVADQPPPPDTYNALWGRWDILLDGRNLGLGVTARKPRTVMGIDESGDTLYLLVIAGGNAGYSLGTSLANAAGIVRAFGATNAMGCDEGGSAGLYLSKFDRTVNHLPGKLERGTYTHFGIATGASKQ